MSSLPAFAPQPDPRLHIQRRADGVVVMRSTECDVRVVELPGGIVFTRFQGRTPLEAWPHRRELLDGCIARHGSVTILTDGIAWRGEGPGFREAWLDWLRQNRKSVRAVHALMGSMVMRTGKEGMATVLGDIVFPYQSRAAFEHAVKKLFPGVILEIVR